MKVFFLNIQDRIVKAADLNTVHKAIWLVEKYKG